jgi:hypothetical protein
MLPMKAVRLELGNLLAADSTTLAPGVTANKIALIMNPFALSENLRLADLTFATFTGSTAISGATGAQEVGVDPTTLQQVIEIKAPIGGYRWITGDTVNLPQTIYGYALTDSTGANLLGVASLPTPIILQDAGQFVSIDPVFMTIVPQPIS